MKELEAFKRIESVIELADDGVDTNTFKGRELEEAILRISDDIELLRKALTPPTSDEVCEALSEYLSVDNGYHYDKQYKWFTRSQVFLKRSGVIIWLMPNGELNISMHLPPHLIEMIGKFYKSLEESK